MKLMGPHLGLWGVWQKQILRWEGELPVRHMQTVLPTLHHGADDLEVVAENCPLGVEAVLHQELQQAVGEHFVPGVILDRYRRTNRTSERHFSHVVVCLCIWWALENLRGRHAEPREHRDHHVHHHEVDPVPAVVPGHDELQEGPQEVFGVRPEHLRKSGTLDREPRRLEISALPSRRGGGCHLLRVDDQLGDEESDVQRRGRVGQLGVQELHPGREFTRRRSLFERQS